MKILCTEPHDKIREEVQELKIRLALEEDRRQRAELELDRLRSDFQELVRITSGRVPPRMGTPLLDHDPFAEVKGGDEYLTPSEDEIVLTLPELEKKLQEPTSEGSA
jgi:hypothetical protein